ncbi:MAG: iron-sulfur cluster assembly scaffold protein [Pseudomonadota bacterium]
MDDLYTNALLEAAASLPAAGALDAPDGQGRRVSKVCGSEVEIDLKLEGGVVADSALRVKACALGQASSSLLAKHLVGASVSELRALQRVMEAMIREDGPAPDGRFADLSVLRAIHDYPARHASTLLIFGAVVDALDEAAARHAAA